MLEEENSRKRSRKQQEEEPFSWKKEIISWIQIIVAAVIIALVLNNFIIANSRVPTGSMENTIMSKSRVIGSRLSYMGLPCPNLCTGDHNAHGKYEFVCIQSMEQTVELLIRIAEKFKDVKKA